MPLTKLDKSLDAAVKAENDRAIADGHFPVVGEITKTPEEIAAYQQRVREALAEPGAFDFLGL